MLLSEHFSHQRFIVCKYEYSATMASIDVQKVPKLGNEKCLKIATVN